MVEKPLVWLAGELKTPPLSKRARVEAGFLLRRLQRGELLPMPFARQLGVLGPRCYELRIRDEVQSWRIVLRVDSDAIVIAEVFAKRTRTIPCSRPVPDASSPLRRDHA